MHRHAGFFGDALKLLGLSVRANVCLSKLHVASRVGSHNEATTQALRAASLRFYLLLSIPLH